jgi:hypothetical protein
MAPLVWKIDQQLATSKTSIVKSYTDIVTIATDYQTLDSKNFRKHSSKFYQ